MKTQVLSASIPLAALSLAFASAEVDAASAGIRGSLLRNNGPMNELTSSELFHAKDIHRRLDEDNNEEADYDYYNGEEEVAEEEEDAQEEEAVEEEEAAEENDWTEDMQYADEEDETTPTTYSSKLEEYEAQAAQIFETAPSEWNVGQWDLMFALFGSILVSCCVLSAFFAYCCIFRDEDDTKYTRVRRLRRRRRHGETDDETVTSEYTKDMSLLTNHTSGLSPKSWVSGSTFFNGNDDSSTVKDHDSKGYSAPSANVVSPIASIASGGIAQVTSETEKSGATLRR